jgi:hypothetical protein
VISRSGGIFGLAVYGDAKTTGPAPAVTAHGGDGDEYAGTEPDNQDGDIVAGMVAWPGRSWRWPDGNAVAASALTLPGHTTRACFGID